MRKLLTTLGILTLATAARFTFPATAQAGDLVLPVGGGGDGGVAGKWAQVCCGGACIGQDYCLGNGTYTCCK